MELELGDRGLCQDLHECHGDRGTRGTPVLRVAGRSSVSGAAAESPIGDNLQPQAGSRSMGEVGGWWAWGLGLESTGDLGVSLAPGGPGTS